MKNAPTITVGAAMKSLSAMEAVKDLPEFKVLQGAINKDVICLGTDEAFALRDDTGEIRAFRQSVRLSAADGTLVQPVMGGPFVVSAQGYEVWAEAAGACVIFPKEVLVNNTWMPNPSAERDPTNRRILAVHARAVAFRFSSKGIPQVSDWTTIFDTPSYRMIDFLGKAKKCPQAFRLLPTGMKPEEDGTWAPYPFDESTTLWMDTSHEEVLKWLAQILNREKKAMDFAQTFAKRNAIKHLSGIQRAPAAQWVVSVLCWRPVSGNIIKWDATQYITLQKRVGDLITGAGDDFQASGQIEMQAGKEAVTDEAGFDVIESETDPEDQPQAEESDPGPGPEKAVDDDFTAEEKRIMTNYDEAMNGFEDVWKKACKDLDLEPAKTTQPPPEIAQKIMKKMYEILDQGEV